MSARRWHELTTREVAALDTAAAVAVLPVGAIEQHGPHLPLATDTIIVDALVEAALERLGPELCVLVLPTQAVGHSLEHTRFAGTLSLAAETLLAAWLDIARGVAATGVSKLVVVNTHGGQKALVDLAAVRMRAELGVLAVRANYFAFGLPHGLFDADEARHGIHGGELETSLMLHIRPDLVHMEHARDFEGLTARMADGYDLLGPEKTIGFGWLSGDLNPAGVCGNAARADADRGRRYLEFLAERLAALVGEVRAMPLDLLDA